MPIMKYWDSESSTWVELDANNAKSLGGKTASKYYNSDNPSNAKKDLSKYQILRSVKDSNGMFTVAEYKTKEVTPKLVMKSTLSGGASPQYTTRTEQWYASDGITVQETVTYTISYDADGDWIGEV